MDHDFAYRDEIRGLAVDRAPVFSSSYSRSGLWLEAIPGRGPGDPPRRVQRRSARPSWAWIGDEAIRRDIRGLATKLMRSGCFPNADVEDIQQDLHLRLLERSRQYDPCRSGWRTFADRVLTNYGRNMCRDQQRQKRGLGHPHMPLDALVRGPRNEVCSVFEFLWRGGREGVEVAETRHDLEVLRDQLTEFEAEILGLLAAGLSRRAIREEMNLKRGELDRGIDSIRRKSSALSLDEY